MADLGAVAMPVLAILQTVGLAGLAIERWIHNRQTYEQETGYRLDGKPSLQAQIDAVREASVSRLNGFKEDLARTDGALMELRRHEETDFKEVRERLNELENWRQAWGTEIKLRTDQMQKDFERHDKQLNALWGKVRDEPQRKER